MNLKTVVKIARKYLTRYASCPLRDRGYGGLSGGGIFMPYTEYHIGASKIVEAVHCILGSINRGFTSNSGLPEINHVVEEFNIIEKTINTYSNDIYTQMMMNQDSEYFERGYQAIRQVAPKLQNQVSSLKDMLIQQDDLDLKIKKLGMACYDVLLALSNALLESVQDMPEKMTDNAYKDPNLRFSISHLAGTIRDVYSTSEY